MNKRMSKPIKSDRQPTGTERELRSVLRRLADTCDNPAHMIELYYWSAEAELIGILRRYITLPDEPRDALRAFLTATADCPETVRVTVSQDGRVTLYAPAVAEGMRREERPRVNDEPTEVVH
jgi:hypothetical protein